MKALITILCMFFAFTATAGERIVENSTKLYTDTFSSKQEAINAGFIEEEFRYGLEREAFHILVCDLAERIKCANAFDFVSE